MTRRTQITLVLAITLLAVTASSLTVGLTLAGFGVVRQVGEDKLAGLTTQQVLARYGNPASRNTEGSNTELWIYYRGRLGGGTGITFQNNVVTHVEMRGAQ